MAKIDLMGDGEGDSPLPGQVPVTDADPDDAEPEFRQPHSQGNIEEDQIQLQEEPSLYYNYGEKLVFSSMEWIYISLSLSLSQFPTRGLFCGFSSLLPCF